MDFFVNVESAFSPMLVRRLNTWFSVNNGNWSDPNTWIGNDLDKKSHIYPQPGDNVWINNAVTCDINATVGNLYGNGYLTLLNSITLTVDGDIQITGTVDQTASSSNLILNGVNNYIVNYTAATSSIMTYNSAVYSQFVMNLPYGSLTISNTGFKYLTTNTSLSGDLQVLSNFECLNYNLTVNGATTINNSSSGLFSKSGAGNILFVGAVTAGGGANTCTIDWSGGNPDVEFRNGFIFSDFSFKTGTGTFTFSTNNQTLSKQSNFASTWNADILVSGAITVTNTGHGINEGQISLTTNGTIDGDNAMSTFNNNGSIYLNNTHLPMSVHGVFNYANLTTSVIGYVMNSVYTLPYSSYLNTLYISGTGVKTLSANTTVNTLNIATNFECSTFNLTVNGVTNVQNGSGGLFSKNGAGSLLFIGAFQTVGSSTIDWSGGNPNVEFRGGAEWVSFYFNTGTGTFTFSTNNQTLNGSVNNTGIFAANILISGAITVTNISGTSFAPQGTIDGNNASSIFINNGSCTYKNATAPMATNGKLYCNQATNTWIYGLAGNQDIQTPVDPVSPGYKNLTLNGSGAKRLLGNVSVKATYTLTSPATLNSNGFSLTNP